MLDLGTIVDPQAVKTELLLKKEATELQLKKEATESSKAADKAKIYNFTDDASKENSPGEMQGNDETDPKNTEEEDEDDGDPNDWCAVCHDGGDTLYCCDRCPKVYHLFCYIPPLCEEPPDDWVRFDLSLFLKSTYIFFCLALTF